MCGVPPNTRPLVIYIGYFVIGHTVLLHYNMSFKTIAGGFNGAFWWYGPFSEDWFFFLQIYQNYLVALLHYICPFMSKQTRQACTLIPWIFFTDAYSRCDFETDLCDWTQLTEDDSDWTMVQASATASLGFDHTLDNDAGRNHITDFAIVAFFIIFTPDFP